jgi:hypothetical protein
MNKPLNNPLHGPMNGALGDWNPFEEKPALTSVMVAGVELRCGDRVRLCPQKKADIMDLALAGQIAVIEAIEQDFEDRVQLAVILDNDPGREFGEMRQPGHRFFFDVDEVEPFSPSIAVSDDADRGRA